MAEWKIVPENSGATISSNGVFSAETNLDTRDRNWTVYYIYDDGYNHQHSAYTTVTQSGATQPPVSCFPCVPTNIEFVDLGLSSHTLWATKNLGAPCPERPGYYYQWGDINGYTEADVINGTKDFGWEDYPFFSGTVGTSSSGFTKYTSGDGKVEIDMEDDAAIATSGITYRIPNRDEWGELISSCTIKPIQCQIPGTTGKQLAAWKFTSNIDGYTDKYITIPDSNVLRDGRVSSCATEVYDLDFGREWRYWTRDIGYKHKDDDHYGAVYTEINYECGIVSVDGSSSVNNNCNPEHEPSVSTITWTPRYWGLQIRPVFNAAYPKVRGNIPIEIKNNTSYEIYIFNGRQLLGSCSATGATKDGASYEMPHVDAYGGWSSDTIGYDTLTKSFCFTAPLVHSFSASCPSCTPCITGTSYGNCPSSCYEDWNDCMKLVLSGDDDTTIIHENETFNIRFAKIVEEIDKGTTYTFFEELENWVIDGHISQDGPTLSWEKVEGTTTNQYKKLEITINDDPDQEHPSIDDIRITYTYGA